MPITKLNKPPKILYPFPVEAEYRKDLINLVSKWENEVRRLVIPKLTNWINESDAQKQDAWAEDINTVMNDLHLTIGKQTDEFLKTELPKISGKTNRWNNKEWTKVVNSVLGIDLVKQEPWLNDQIQSWISENTDLIKNLQSNTEKEINNVVTQGVLQGQRSKTIEKRLLSKAKLKAIGASPFDSTVSALRRARNRAKLIADDQVGKLNSQLIERRQTDLGIQRYRWRNVKDIRVRGNPSGLYPNTTYSHWDREGKIFSWDKAPPDGHPGYSIRCRCWAEPVFEDIVDMDKSTVEKKVFKLKPKIDKSIK